MGAPVMVCRAPEGDGGDVEVHGGNYFAAGVPTGFELCDVGPSRFREAGEASVSGREESASSRRGRARSLGGGLLSAMQTLRTAFARAVSPSPLRERACEGVLREIERSEGRPATHQLAAEIRSHFENLPTKYCAAGFTSDDVFLHMRLLADLSKPPAECPTLHTSVKHFPSRGLVAILRRHHRSISLPSQVSFRPAATAGDCSCSCSPDSSHGRGSEASDAQSVSTTEEEYSEGSCREGGVLRHVVSFAHNQAICGRQLQHALACAGLAVKKVQTFQSSKHVVVGRIVLKGKAPSDLETVIREVFSQIQDGSLRAESLKKRGLVRSTSRSRIADSGSGRWEEGDVALDLSYEGSPSRCSDVEIGNLLSTNSCLGRWLLRKDKLEMGKMFAVGASGDIFRGTYDGQDVAIKVLKVSAGAIETKAVLEFQREVAALSLGSHPNLLPFLGVCVEGGQLCILTKYMPGLDLAALVASGPLPLPKALKVARDIAEGMHCLHEHDIIHRDLKSANVLLDSDGTAKVGDFGVSRLCGEKEEMTCEVGTYRWMAPECLGAFAGTPTTFVTKKVDVFSFGIILWEMMTGLVPYSDYTPLQAAVGVVLNDLRPTIPPGSPISLAELAQRCWARDPQQRPDFAEILQELNQLVVAGAEESS